MSRIAAGSILVAVLSLFVSTASAQMNIDTGNLNFTANQLAEVYFDVDFGSTAHSETWDLTLTWSADSGASIDFVDCDAASAATNFTEWGSSKYCNQYKRTAYACHGYPNWVLHHSKLQRSPQIFCYGFTSRHSRYISKRC